MSSLIEQRTPACALGLSTETLSAWRDDGLPPDEARRVREHAATCAACQERLAAFDLVARALSRQRELEPGDRIWSGVRARMANARRAGWRASLGGLAGAWRAIVAAACLAAVVALLAYILGNAAARRGPSVVGTPTPRPQPTATATAIPTPTLAPGTFTVSDAATARQLSFAYALDGEVWVSQHGAPPQQMTHVGLTDPSLQWWFTWTPDATKLLVNAGSFDGTHAQAWIISLPDGAVTSLPASSPLVEGCGHLCYWVSDRYIVQGIPAGSHYERYQVYDTQARRVVPSGLDGQSVTEVEVRGDSIYFSPYESADVAHYAPGRIRRASVGNQTVTTSFTLPGPLVDEGIPFGSWDLSADGRRVVASLNGAYPNVVASCPSGNCYTFYQDIAAGTCVSSSPRCETPHSPRSTSHPMASMPRPYSPTHRQRATISSSKICRRAAS